MARIGKTRLVSLPYGARSVVPFPVAGLSENLRGGPKLKGMVRRSKNNGRKRRNVDEKATKKSFSVRTCVREAAKVLYPILLTSRALEKPASRLQRRVLDFDRVHERGACGRWGYASSDNFATREEDEARLLG